MTPGTGRMVQFPTNGSATFAYLATPASGKGPGVLVLQEWWGLVPHIKHVCDRFAAEGFSALAPDMYHGHTATEPDGAGKLFMALNIAQAEKDLRGAATHLGGHSSTSPIGAVGFCMGGQLALFAATLNPSVGACVNFYGIHPNVKPDYTKLSGPVLGLYAEKDGFVTPSVARQVDADIKKAGKHSEIHIYPGVDHAFFNDERSDVYDKTAAADAWRRTLAFFRQHLR
jgi:carboxymethylenebutenolidase